MSLMSVKCECGVMLDVNFITYCDFELLLRVSNECSAPVCKNLKRHKCEGCGEEYSAMFEIRRTKDKRIKPDGTRSRGS